MRKILKLFWRLNRISMFLLETIIVGIPYLLMSIILTPMAIANVWFEIHDEYSGFLVLRWGQNHLFLPTDKRSRDDLRKVLEGKYPRWFFGGYRLPLHYDKETYKVIRDDCGHIAIHPGGTDYKAPIIFRMTF